MERYALIVAGGNGTRMGSEIPKQFLVIAGKPILMHTLALFHQLKCKLVLVLPENQFAYWNDLCQQCAFTLPLTLIAGGSSRFHSVQNGLAAVPKDSLVAIHDGVRPCTLKTVVEASFERAAQKGNAITAVLPKDSIRLVDGAQNTSVDRALYRLIQTPQTFLSTLIKRAYTTATHPNFTDDAGVLEAAGYSIELIEGDYKNIKVTTPEDLIVAEIFLKQRS